MYISSKFNFKIDVKVNCISIENFFFQIWGSRNAGCIRTMGNRLGHLFGKVHIFPRENIWTFKENEKVISLQNLYKSHMELVLAKPALHNFWEYWLQKLSKTCFPCVTKIFSCLLQKDLFCSLFSYEFTNSAPLIVCFFLTFF